jgi:hypothetical protein
MTGAGTDLKVVMGFTTFFTTFLITSLLGIKIL